MRDERRFFSGSLRRSTLAALANGKCERCGCDLEKGWHADHVLPWSAGGETEIENMQALCQACNLKKGSAMSGLRNWQERAFRQCITSSENDFFLEATPGAGKTIFAAHVIRQRIQAGVQRTVIVVPTLTLKEQWADVLHRFEIDAEHRWYGDCQWPRGFNAVCVTYQQVASNPELFRGLTYGVDSMAVFDEVHHCSTDNGQDWGQKMQHAFGKCAFRLSLSGTPFRSDNNPIPFLRYSADGNADPDFVYGYGHALKDGVCRIVMFPKRGGLVEWCTHRGEFRSRTFDEECQEDERKQRIWTALTAGDWMKDTIRTAHASLMEMREDDPDAAGLIVCIDQPHANQVNEIMRDTIGVTPVVAVSDDPDAAEKIKAFSEDKSPWIVAVKMVSEGVDIPRLRVGIFATNCGTRTFFRQVVGRFVRVQPGHEDHTAQLFIYGDDNLCSLAAEIKEQVVAHIDQEIKDEKQRERHERIHDSDHSFFTPINSTSEDSGTIVEGEDFSTDELSLASELSDGLKISPAIAATLLRRAGRLERTEPQRTQPPRRKKADEKKRLKELTTKLARQIAFCTGTEHKNVNAELNRMAGIKSSKTASVEELQRRFDAATKWYERLGQ